MHTAPPMIASSFAYLLWHSVWNRVVARIRRARNPRYLVASLAGAAYMAYFWLRPLLQTSAGTSSPETARLVASIGQGVAVGLILAQALYWWVFGGNRLTLAFTEAEVAFLFTAPISRRALIGYKLVRTQIASIFSVALGVLLLRRGSPTLPIPLRAIGLWLFFTTPGLHSIGSALVRASWAEHGLQGVRRQRLAIAVMVVVMVLVVVGVLQNLPTLRTASDATELGASLTTMLTSGALGVVLWPVRATVAPMLSATASAWARAMPAALAILALHVVWVFRSDAAFQEAALAASAARAARVEAFRARRAGGAIPSAARVAKGTIRLAPTGHPAVAVVWKNVLALRRRSGFGTLVFFGLAPLAWGAIAGWMGQSAASAVATSALVLAAGIMLIGPMLMRNDLRQDMLNIVSLKVLPLSGRTIVASEVLSVVVPVALVELALLGSAAIAAPLDPSLGVTPAESLWILATGFPMVLGLEGALVTILNAAPVLFPGWARLGMGTDARMERIGGQMVSMSLVALLLAVMLALPAGLGAVIVFLGKAHIQLAVVGALLTGGAVLGAELYGALGLLGGAFERAEPSEIG